MALGWLKDVADIGSTIAGTIGLFRGKDEPAGLGQFEQLMKQAQAYASGIANPPAEKVAEEEATLRRDFSEALRLAMAADRRERARGRGGLFYDRERQDETMSRVAAAYHDDVKQKARENVRNYFVQAANANNLALGQAGALVQLQSGLDDQNRSMRASGFEALFEGLRGLSDNETFGNLFSDFGGRLNLLDGGRSNNPIQIAGNPLRPGAWANG